MSRTEGIERDVLGTGGSERDMLEDIARDGDAGGSVTGACRGCTLKS